MILLRLSTILLSYVSLSNAYTFWFTSTPTQCANTTVQWSDGGQPPFTLLLIPVGHLQPETRTIIQRSTSVGNSISFTLDFPAQSQFVAVLNDASGVGTGGTSVVTTVASSSDSSCLPTTPSETKFFFFLPGDIGQCDTIDISWQSNAEDPVDILGLIPGGQSFEIANITDGSTDIDWTADVRAGQDIVFVAGDKDGLGTGGSSDVTQVESGSDDCIDDSSPSSTTGPAAGGVSTAGGGGQTGKPAGGSPTSGTQTGASSSPTESGQTGSAGSGSGGTPAGTGTNTGSSGGSTQGSGGSGGGGSSGSGTSTQGSGGNGGSSNGGGSSGSGSGFPGSGGGTVTGLPDINSSTHHDKLGLILGLVFGLLALFGLATAGIVLYRRRRRREATYLNLDNDSQSRMRPWIASLARGVHLRGGAGSSVDTLPSMYQTEPFILPAEQQQPISRPTMAARASSNRSLHALLGDVPYARDAFGGGLAGMHGPFDKDSVGPHGMPPSRTPSGRAAPSRGAVITPISTEAPTRITRDSEDFSPDAEVASPNPFEETYVEIPPTYASVRRASRSKDREPWQSAGPAQLGRSNASRHSRRSNSVRTDRGYSVGHETT